MYGGFMLPLSRLRPLSVKASQLVQDRKQASNLTEGQIGKWARQAATATTLTRPDHLLP